MCCVTYKVLADFMDGLSAEMLALYSTGRLRVGEPLIAVSELIEH